MRVTILLQVFHRIIQGHTMVFQKAVHLHRHFKAEQPAHLFLTQPLFLIAFQGKLFEDMARHVLHGIAALRRLVNIWQLP